jgi:uncharacterized protein YjbI with pentapeptide repeats
MNTVAAAVQDLRRSNFTSADCRRANFKNSNLQGAYFSKLQQLQAAPACGLDPASFALNSNAAHLGHAGHDYVLAVTGSCDLQAPADVLQRKFPAV